jgi:DNA polymerase III epsilon subunit-like protein
MLKHHYELATGQTMKSAGFDLERAHREGKLLDVIDHQWNMEGKPVTPRGPYRRSLSDSKLYAKKKDTLCDLYGVKQGDHSAAEDARASLDVAVRQILTNQGKFTPNQPRLG